MEHSFRLYDFNVYNENKNLKVEIEKLKLNNYEDLYLLTENKIHVVQNSSTTSRYWIAT